MTARGGAAKQTKETDCARWMDGTAAGTLSHLSVRLKVQVTEWRRELLRRRVFMNGL
jgi:hypothetical protein